MNDGYLKIMNNKRTKMKNKLLKTLKKYISTEKYNLILVRIVKVLSLFLLALVIELFVFNFRAWQSIFYKEQNNDIQVVGFKNISDDEYIVTNEGERYIELKDINYILKNARVEIVNIDSEANDEAKYIDVRFEGIDEGHSNYYGLCSRKITHKEERSFYVTFHMYGDAESLKIIPDVSEGQNIRINIATNVKIPVFFYWDRYFFILIILLLVYLFRPKSILNNIQYNAIEKKKRLLLLSMLFIINAVILQWITEINGFYQYEPQINHEQYQKLAESFLNGRLSIMDEPIQELKNMDNPYDMNARANEVGEGNYYFDYAYFNGKYFVYFGVVPVILIYLPYYAINGEHIHNHSVCYIGILILLSALILLYDAVLKKYCRKCSLAIFLSTFELSLIGSFIIYIAKRPDLYAIPIVYGIAFALLGMWLFLMSWDDTNKRFNNLFLSSGSICFALVAGCRPQLFLFFVLGLIIIWKHMFSDKYMITRYGIKSLISISLPMLVVAVLLMTYNYKRFGSVFDFGAFYNLTFNDMRYRGYVGDRNALGIITYLFRPLELASEYPFFRNLQMNSTYMGQTVQEDTYGGLFAGSPFAMIGLLSFLYYKYLRKNKKLWLLSVVSIFIALIIIIFDIQNAGILGRYFFDFSLLFMFASSLTVWNIVQIIDDNSVLYRSLVKVLICLLLFSVFYQTQIFMLDAGDILKSDRMDLFIHYYYLFEFFL